MIADPEQTHEVFTVIRALSGPALQNGYVKFCQTELGRKVLHEEIDLLDTHAVDALRERFVNELNWKGPLYLVCAISGQGTRELAADIMTRLEAMNRENLVSDTNSSLD